MTAEFNRLNPGLVRGFFIASLNPAETSRIRTSVTQLVDYVSNFIYVLAEGDSNNQFTLAANETKQLMESGKCEFWSVGGRNLPWFAKAAIIFPGASRLEAYATIVLNLDRFFPFDQATLSQEAKEEIILAVVDLPGARKLLETKDIKGLTPTEFLTSIENDPEGQIIVPVRDLMPNQ